MSDILKRLAVAEAEVALLRKLAEEEARVTFGFVPDLKEEYFYVDDCGDVQIDIFADLRFEQNRSNHGVYRTRTEAEIEAIYRTFRRYGVRAKGRAAVGELWFWNPHLNDPFMLRDFSHQLRVACLLSGNAFETEAQAKKYGTEILPQIVKKVLG